MLLRAQKSICALENIFCAESGFPRKKWISGENVILGGNTTNSELEFILFRGFCGFRCFRDAKKWIFAEFHRFSAIFMKKVEFT